MKLNKFQEIFNLDLEKEDFQNVVKNIENAVVFKGTNLWILIFAIFIASLGLNVNSTAVIIGAMLISPLMGPIMGIGFSVAINNPILLKNSLKNFFIATFVGLITSFIYFSISPLSEAHSEILARTSPNIYDVLIAFFGGCAGMLTNGSKIKGNVIPGVAIATALMPPLCTAGYGIATAQYSYFYGALYLYIINTVFIAVATILMVKVLNFQSYQFDKSQKSKKWKIIMWMIIIATLIPSIWFGYRMIEKNRFEQNAQNFIKNEASFNNNFLLSQKVNFEKKEIELIYGGQKLNKKDFSELINKATKYSLIGTKIIVKQGFNFIPKTENNLDIVEKQNINNAIKLFDSISAEQKLSKEILQELKTQNENISSFSLNNTTIKSDSLNVNTKIAIILSDDKLQNTQKEEISKFLKVRLKDENSKIIFEEK